MPQRVWPGHGVVHVQRGELIAIVRERVADRIAGIGLRHRDRRGVARLQLAVHAREGQRHALDVSARRASAVPPFVAPDVGALRDPENPCQRVRRRRRPIHRVDLAGAGHVQEIEGGVQRRDDGRTDRWPHDGVSRCSAARETDAPGGIRQLSHRWSDSSPRTSVDVRSRSARSRPLHRSTRMESDRRSEFVVAPSSRLLELSIETDTSHPIPPPRKTRHRMTLPSRKKQFCAAQSQR